MKKIFSILVMAAAMLIACNEPEPPTPGNEDENNQTEEPVELQKFKLSVPVTDNWVWESKPNIIIKVENPNSVAVTATAKVQLYTDLGKKLDAITKDVEFPANKTTEVALTTPEDLAPGIYKAVCSVKGKSARTFFFAISPEKIISAPDMQPDFNEYWESAKATLPNLEECEPILTEIKSKSSAAEKVYLVELKSTPDTPNGEPVTVRGYYVEPQDGEKHPVIFHFYGYDDQNPTSKASCPSGGSKADYAEFYFSIRGQMLNNRKASQREPDGQGDFVNIYGDWFAYQFGDLDGYYYRGAFLDCVQAVRFMASRPTSDMNNLFAEGSSQGGALCYATAALSDYPFTAIAPNVAFLGDFPDYFQIVSWPGNTAKANQGSMSDEEMYRFLSYFDTKNHATRIGENTAVWATSGLQDGTCPPHTNLAPFNNLIGSDKKMNIYPEMQHAYPSSWSSDINKFFKERIK